MPISARLIRAGKSLFLFLGASLLVACMAGDQTDQSTEVAVQGLYSAALSADASLAVAGSIVHGGSLWQSASQERLFDWNHRRDAPTEITAIAFSPDGGFAVTVEHEDMVLWNTVTGASLTWFSAPAEVLSIDLGPGAQHAVLGLVDHTAVLFDIRRGGGNLRVFNHQGRVRSVSLSDNGESLLTGAEDGTARYWDVQAGEQMQLWQHDEMVRLVELSPAGDLALSVSKYDRAVVWDTGTGEEIGEIPLRSTAVQRGLTFTAARFSADGSQLLTGSSDRRIQLWDSSTVTELANWSLPKRKAWKPTGAAVMALAFDSATNGYYAIASNGLMHRVRR